MGLRGARPSRQPPDGQPGGRRSLHATARRPARPVHAGLGLLHAGRARARALRRLARAAGCPATRRFRLDHARQHTLLLRRSWGAHAGAGGIRPAGAVDRRQRAAAGGGGAGPPFHGAPRDRRRRPGRHETSRPPAAAIARARARRVEPRAGRHGGARPRAAEARAAGRHVRARPHGHRVPRVGADSRRTAARAARVCGARRRQRGQRRGAGIRADAALQHRPATATREGAAAEPAAGGSRLAGGGPHAGGVAPAGVPVRPDRVHRGQAACRASAPRLARQQLVRRLVAPARVQVSHV
mmetsp:Transcript_47418/g.120027  ORF Transcript_47418/g.120027 Transcript_47418/m.120027 type:complete len:298 (+) Transcript_47418:628-1521(+)